ncbi:MAG: hypothetical protein U9N45_08250, partial [Gemmatimonadota bacterium]|nr:hypothetical protein [Gemmatimonadota bacterium]
MKRFEVSVFGKQGCDKCKLLHKRLGKILADKKYKDFELAYYDLGTVEGLVHFCRCEVLNPQRIPGFIVLEKEPDDESAENTVRAIRPVLYSKKVSDLDEDGIVMFVSLETDYSSTG